MVTGNEFHLAQVNVGRLLAPIDDPVIAEFVAQLDEINVLAERRPGFVWRFKARAGMPPASRRFPIRS